MVVGIYFTTLFIRGTQFGRRIDDVISYILLVVQKTDMRFFLRNLIFYCVPETKFDIRGGRLPMFVDTMFVCCFTSYSRIFHSGVDVIIAAELLD